MWSPHVSSTGTQGPGRTGSRALQEVSGAAAKLPDAAALTAPPTRRYYFKKVSDEFECGVVFEEVREDGAVLPVFEEKVIGKVEKVD